MNYTGPLVFTGDHLARTASQPTNMGNPGDSGFGMNVWGASAVGGAGDFYRLVWVQNANGHDTTFKNGQIWSIQKYDPALDPGNDPYANDAGWPATDTGGVFKGLMPKDDLVAGMGGGEDHIVFENQGSGGHLILDLSRSFAPISTDVFYPGPDDGQLNFTDFTAGPSGFLPAEGIAPEAGKSANCFTPGTMIDTPDGPRAIETLGVGDLVLTIDNGPQPILWTGSRTILGLAEATHLRPIRIAAGALGPGLPSRDLTVSPQHRILIRSASSKAMFGSAEILAAAKQLVAVDGIEAVEDLVEVTYIHILLARHELVRANGAVTETMYLGPEALKACGPVMAARIRCLAGLAGPDAELPKARPTPRGSQARRLASKHVASGRPLVLPLPEQELQPA